MFGGRGGDLEVVADMVEVVMVVGVCFVGSWQVDNLWVDMALQVVVEDNCMELVLGTV